ncbi:MAG: UDP-N-acetylmuramoyl-L-alanyl-D-glutamate--LD-lysine ligase [Firmicutes bacterium ADurb.Bin182]|nr:MAG: UDP-N-acetylmuramoyl-L-alanyl-D-glutamate--LD-lysine ligase [Firmicutes bacterium ADurb.Bin182]
MLLSDLVDKNRYRLVGENVDINKIEYDSRKVSKGDLFCCIVGSVSDGHDFARQAVESGASALLVERELPIDIPMIVADNTRIAMAELAAAYYGHPAKGMRLIGVTGTNGKTTTTHMIKSIAEQAGLKVGMIGTIHNMIGNESIDTDRTTPESVDLQAILRRMKDEAVGLVVMEVSSHSLVQYRVHGVEFDIGVFTNLTQDHLDYHKSFDNYVAAKKMLFAQSKRAVINLDDAHGAKIKQELSIPVTTFGITSKADTTASDIEITAKGVQFDIHTPQGSTRMHIPIPGLFSVFNAMGAVAVALEIGLPMSAIKRGMENMLSVSGRLEPLPTGSRDFTVLLDYAHTPDALENILKTVREFAKARIVTLFGCGGDRDKAKRPIMGETAGRFSDFLIVTSDNPRSEDPYAIIASIEEGVKKSGCGYVIIENRKEAIKYALENAQKDDIIVLAGKGHESYQEIRGVKHHFDEKEIVAELLSGVSG